MKYLVGLYTVALFLGVAAADRSGNNGDFDAANALGLTVEAHATSDALVNERLSMVGH